MYNHVISAERENAEIIIIIRRPMIVQSIYRACRASHNTIIMGGYSLSRVATPSRSPRELEGVATRD